MTTIEDSTKVESNQTTDTSSRSITDRLSMGPFMAAGRLMSCLSKQPRLTPSKRNYTMSAVNPDKPLLFKPSSKRIYSARRRSTSPLNSSSIHNSATTPSNLNEIYKSSTPPLPSIPTPDTIGAEFNFQSTYLQLQELAQTNCTYFSQQKTDVCQRFQRLLQHLIQSIDTSLPLITSLIENFPYFDYSTEVNNIITMKTDLSFDLF